MRDAREELQSFVNGYGFGISVERLADKVYFHMNQEGYPVCMVNEKYVNVEGTTYYFSKSKKQGCWIVKAF